MALKVIDLSHYNVIPNADGLLKAKDDSGIVGVIHKATEGTGGLDAKLRARFFMAKQAGLLWGMYHFLKPGAPSAQVSHFLTATTLYMDKDTLVACDYEDPNVPLSDLVAFLEELQSRLHRSPVLYGGSVLKEALRAKPSFQPTLSKYRLWLAQYRTEPPEFPDGFNTYWLWQYTDKELVGGIDPPVDCSVSQLDIDTFSREWAGNSAILTLQDMMSIDITNVPPNVPLSISVGGTVVYDSTKRSTT